MSESRVTAAYIASIDEGTPSEELAATVVLLRDVYLGTIVLLEGATDSRLFEKFTDDFCQTIVCFGRQRVVGALEILETKVPRGSQIDGVFAVADSDFNQVLPETIPEYVSENLVYTDSHDFETMMLSSRALGVVLQERGKPEKIRQFVDRTDRPVSQALIEAARPIALLRLLSHSEKMALTFKGMDFTKFVDARTLKTDVTELLRILKAQSKRLDLKDSDILEKMTLLEALDLDPWQLCNGHDLVAILAIGLHKVLGTHDAKQVTPEIVQSYLRMSYDFTDLMETTLYAAIRAWERRTGWKVFRSLPGNHGEVQQTAS